MPLWSDFNGFPESGFPTLANEYEQICLGTLYNNPLKINNLMLDVVGNSRLLGSLVIGGAMSGVTTLAIGGALSGATTIGASGTVTLSSATAPLTMSGATALMTMTGENAVFTMPGLNSSLGTVLQRINKGYFNNLILTNRPTVGEDYVALISDLRPMTYPGAGITISTGSAWDTSITPATGYLRYTGSVFEWKNETYLTSVTAHDLLSATHGDTLADTVVRGDILVGNSTPKWARLAFPATPTGKVLIATATDIAWSTNALGTAAYTASGDYATASHAHGSITNGGAIASTTALASGDWLVFSDADDSNILKKASITIGAATTTFLRNDGTWAKPSTGLIDDYNNILIGTNAGYSLTTGDYNIFIGPANTGYTTQGGNYNIFFGHEAGTANVSGIANTYIGSYAGRDATGSSNVFLGFQAGMYETGSSKLIIDNVQRTDEATTYTKALIYGIFDSTYTNQILRINAKLELWGSTTYITKDGSNNMTFTDAVTGTKTLADLVNASSQWTTTGSDIYFANKVMIGSTSAPVVNLHLSGGNGAAPNTSGTTHTGTVRMVTADNGVLDMGIITGGLGAWLQSVDQRNLATNYPLLLNPNGGNVSIGTINADSKLHLYNYTTSDSNLLTLQNGANWATPMMTSINIKDGTNTVGAIGWKWDGASTIDCHFHSLYNSAYKSVSDIVMTIKGNGNVGIGTSAPYEKLDVYGNIACLNELTFDATTNGTAPGYINYDGYQGGNTQFRNLYIMNGKRSTVMYVDGVNSRIGICNSSPSYALDVTGKGRFTSTVEIGAYVLPATDGSASQVLKTDGSGTVSWATPSTEAFDVLSSSASVSWDCSTGLNKTLTRGGNFTLTLSNYANGMVGTVRLDITSTTTITLSASGVTFKGSGSISSLATGIYYLSWICTSTSAIEYNIVKYV